MGQSRELFALSTATPEGIPFHGAATVRGSAQASAEFRRGVDLSAGFDFGASVGGDVGNQLRATFSAGVGVRGGLAVQAMFPIDLFTSAGIVARFRAQIEASAYVRATLALQLDEFYRLLRGQVPAGPMERMLEIFLEEVEIEAGLWARAAFAAQIFGEATLTGSLLGSPGMPAGFTFSLQYGIGWIYGTGYQFLTNINIENPRRLLDRLADNLADLALQEVDRHVSRLSEDEAARLEPAVAAVRVLLPLATRSSFQLGVDLASASANRSDQAVSSFVDSVVREAQYLLLRAALELAANEISKLLAHSSLQQRLAELDEDELDAAIRSLYAVRDGVKELPTIDVADVGRWMPLFVGILPAFEGFLTNVMPPADFVQECRSALAIGWAAGVLLERIVSWVDDPNRAMAELFGQSAVVVPDGGSHLETHIKQQLGKAETYRLTLGDMASFLAGVDLESGFRKALPELAATLDWLAGALNTQLGGFARQILIVLVGGGMDKKRQVLAIIANAFSSAIQSEIIPKLIGPIRAANAGNKPLVAFLDEMVVPILVAMPQVIIPRLAELDDPAMAVRFREALSSVLLQSFNRFVIGAIDVLLQHALTEGATALRGVSNSISQLGEREPAFGLLTMAASRAVLPVTVTPADARSLLVLSADVIDLWNGRQREALLDSIRILVTMGLSTEDTRNASFTAIVGGDKPASEADLKASLDRLTDGLWEIAKFATPRLLGLIALHYLNEAKAVAEAIWEGAKAVVAAAVQAAEWVGRQLEELWRQLGVLLQQIGEWFAHIASDIAALARHLKTLVSDVVTAIRNAGFAILKPLIVFLPGWAQDAIKGLYDALFDSIAWVATAPLQILSAVADWVEGVLTGRFGTVADDESSIHDEVKRRIATSSAFDIHFDLKIEAYGVTIVDLGRVTLPCGSIASAIADVVSGDSIYKQTVRSSARYTTAIRAAQAQEQTIRQAISGELNQQQAQTAISDLVPGTPLHVVIGSPLNQSLNTGRADVAVRIEGANRTFVQSTLGVPPRVSILLNGIEQKYESGFWGLDTNGLGLVARVVVEQPRTSPLTVEETMPARREAYLRLHTGVAATISAENRTVSFMTPRSGSPGKVRRIGTVDAEPLAGSKVAFERMAVALGASKGVAGRAAPVPVEAVGFAEISGKADVMSRAPVTSGHFSTEVISRELVSPVAMILDSGGVPVMQGHPGLNALQVAVSDGKGNTQSASAVFFLQTSAIEKPQVSIEPMEHGRAGDLRGDHLVIRSETSEPVDLSGWTLRDLSQRVFRFPEMVLQPGQTLTVWTGSGTPDEKNLYLGRKSALLAKGEKTAVLSDPSGREVHRMELPGPRRRPKPGGFTEGPDV